MRFSGKDDQHKPVMVGSVENSATALSMHEAADYSLSDSFGDGARPVSTGATMNSSSSVSVHPHAALASALIGGLIAVLLSSIPLRAAFVLALLVGGFVCVLVYRRWNPGARLSPARGFRLGALAGLFGFAILILLGAVEMMAFHLEEKQREAVLEIVRQTQAHTADAQARQMLDYFTTEQGMVVMMLLGFIFMAISFVVLSGVGGAVSASLARKDPREF